MRTAKQVSDLTGISVRMLHYYDEIGLLKPSEVTESGYRLYNNEALETLQQILFFKELDIPLKEVKEIMVSPYFDKMQALENQKKLLILKRDRFYIIFFSNFFYIIISFSFVIYKTATLNSGSK